MPNFNNQPSVPQEKSVYPLNVLGKVAAKPFYIWANEDCSNKSDIFDEAKAIRLKLFNDGGTTVHIVDADGVEVVDAEIEAHEVLAKHDYFVGARKSEVRPDCPGAFMVNDPLDPDGYAIVGDDLAALIMEARDHLINTAHERGVSISRDTSTFMAEAQSSLVDGEVLGIDADGSLIQWDGHDGVAYNSGQTAQDFGMDNFSEPEKERLNLKGSGVPAFDYQLLARLQQDCDYYLGHGNRAKKHLWAGGEAEQIAKMKELYSGLREKPEWISLEDISSYEARMLTNFIDHSASGKTGTFAAKFDQHAERNGQQFTVLGALNPSTFDEAECGEMFVIRFADGVQIEAWPEEVESAMNESNFIEQAPATKLVEVRLSALTRVEYMEVVEVPADITQAELDDLVNARYRQVDGGEFTSDPEYWERGTCEAVETDMPNAAPSMMAFRTAKGLHIERADAAAQTVESSGPTP